MTRSLRIPAAVLTCLLCAGAQSGLPPGILVLARVKAHMRDQLARLPNCSCLETISRQFRPPGGNLRPLDTIRLEVLYSDGKELYAPPGDRKFVNEHPSSFAGGGMIGDGFFALYLSDVTGEGRVSYEYKARRRSVESGWRVTTFDCRRT